jgi:hypothetical protein
MIGYRLPVCKASDYHLDRLDVTDQPTLSASLIKTLLTSSPAHARAAHPRFNPDIVKEDKAHFDLGTAAHALFFEGDAGVQVCHFDSWRTKDAKEAALLARAHGKIPMLPDQLDECQAMVAAIREQLDRVAAFPALFTGGKPEQTIVWEENGVWCRSRLDYLHDDASAIDDLKTTSQSANPDAWSRRALFDNGCDIQAALYRRGVQALTGVTPKWRWVVVETGAPYALSVITPTQPVLALANDKIDKALTIWADCLKRDVWPAYPPVVHEAELPAWEESRWLEREAREEIAA